MSYKQNLQRKQDNILKKINEEKYYKLKNIVFKKTEDKKVRDAACGLCMLKERNQYFYN